MIIQNIWLFTMFMFVCVFQEQLARMMAIVSTRLSFPNVLSNPSAKNNSSSSRTCSPIHYSSNAKVDVEYLKSEFRTRGVSFTGIGNSCVVRMEVEGGSAANLMLPSGLITSFKPQMWHGATVELLHTFVSQTQSSPANVQGGLSLALSLHNEAAGVSWSPDSWALHQVNPTPESIQVELISTSDDNTCQVKHIITLERDRLNSHFLVSNSATSSLHLMGSAMCHLTVSTPDAVYALGLQASDYFIRPPFQTSFSIIPPDFWTGDQQLNKWDVEDDVERELTQQRTGEEDDNCKHLTEKLSRIYTSAPRSLTIIDRGRRNSVTVRRQGFKEVYIFSPGSEYEWYNNYSYICIANSAVLDPVILDAQTEWRGGLQLWNPNS